MRLEEVAQQGCPALLQELLSVCMRATCTHSLHLWGLESLPPCWDAADGKLCLCLSKGCLRGV